MCVCARVSVGRRHARPGMQYGTLAHTSNEVRRHGDLQATHIPIYEARSWPAGGCAIVARTARDWRRRAALWSFARAIITRARCTSADRPPAGCSAWRVVYSAVHTIDVGDGLTTPAPAAPIVERTSERVSPGALSGIPRPRQANWRRSSTCIGRTGMCRRPMWRGGMNDGRLAFVHAADVAYRYRRAR